MVRSVSMEQEGAPVSEPQHRLTEMDFDEVSFVNDGAHQDAKVVLFKMDGGSDGPGATDVHVNKPLGSDEDRKKKKRKVKELLVQKLLGEQAEKKRRNSFANGTE